MNLLDWLFRKKQSVPIEPSAEMLDENLYWKIVAESLEASNNKQEKQEKYLLKRLQALSTTEIIGFKLRTDKLLYDTYTSEMWCAAYLMNGGCSDDSFEYFRNWVISRGKNVYYSAKSNPDNLIDIVDNDLEDYDFEGFWFVADNAFERKTSKNLLDFVLYDQFKFHEGHYPNFDFTREEDNPESMRAICPRLFELF
ncbi:MAG: hypothetical protein RLZZ292_955 [Bacteroidota bacterium]|jgi:hypothetical protein